MCVIKLQKTPVFAFDTLSTRGRQPLRTSWTAKFVMLNSANRLHWIFKNDEYIYKLTIGELPFYRITDLFNLV